MWVLREAGDAETGQLTFRILPGGMKTIGRTPNADFMVDRALVSRVHCRLIHTDDRLEVEDLDSTNGTFVNDQRVARKILVTGDRLRVGRVELIVSQEDLSS